MSVERPQQLVATNAAVATAVGLGCVAKVASPGTGDMLTTGLTIDKGTRVLLLSFCFKNATTIDVYKTVSGGAAAAMGLFEGATFDANKLYSHIACPVEELDLINFRLGTANNTTDTVMFKVEGACGR